MGRHRHEAAERTLKDPLKLRPIFQWTDRRVRAHVIICLLACLLQKVFSIYCERARLKLSPRPKSTAYPAEGGV
jgi:transposase